MFSGIAKAWENSFQQRNKRMEKITTVCARDCYDACSLTFSVNDSAQIHSVKGDPLHPFTQGFTCPRGTKDHERLQKNRVQSPGFHQKGTFEYTDWEDALNMVSHKLVRIPGPDGSIHSCDQRAKHY